MKLNGLASVSNFDGIAHVVLIIIERVIELIVQVVETIVAVADIVVFKHDWTGSKLGP